MKTSQFSTLVIIGIVMILCSSFLYSQSWNGTGGPNIIHEVLDVSIGYNSSVQLLYATDVDQLKVSTNGGTQWTATGQSLSNPVVVTVRANNRNIALVGKVTGDNSNGLFYTTDGGSSWEDVTPDDATGGYQPQRVIISIGDPNLVLLGTEKVGNGSGQTSLFKSVNGGASWSGINYFKNNARTYVNDVLPYPSETYKDYIFVGGSSNNAVEPPSGAQEPIGITTRGVWRSTDQGVNWSYQTTGINSTDLNVTALGISLDGSGNPVLFAAAAINNSHAKLYQTTDVTGETITWQDAAGTLPDEVTVVRSIAVNPADYQQILLATDVGVYGSTNRGSSWTEQNTNLPTAGQNVHRVAFDLTSGTIAYIATGEGIYKGTYSSGSWSWTQQITTQTALEARSLGISNGTLFNKE